MAAGSVAACWWEFSDRWPPGRYPSRQSRRGRRAGIRRGVRCPRPGRRTVRRTCRVMPHRRPQPLREATDCQHEDEQLAVQGDHRVVVGQNAPCLRGIAGCDGSAALATPAARTHDRSPNPRHLRVVVSSIQSAAAADRMSGLANNGAKVFAGTTTPRLRCNRRPQPFHRHGAGRCRAGPKSARNRSSRFRSRRTCSARCASVSTRAVWRIESGVAGRVRAHVFLRMPSYYLSWHMKQDLAPILFCDHR